jgi:hypothetical protein
LISVEVSAAAERSEVGGLVMLEPGVASGGFGKLESRWSCHAQAWGGERV